MRISVLFFFTLLLLNILSAEGQVRRKIFDLKKNFGAKGNGVVNDQMAFEAAAKAINKLGGNCILIIPRGNYKVGHQAKNDDQELLHGVPPIELINCNNVEIFGRGATIKFTDGLYFGTFSSTLSKIENQKMPFYTRANATSTGSIFDIRKCNDINIHDLVLDGNSSKYVIGGPWGDTGYQLASDGVIAFEVKRFNLRNLKCRNFGRDGLMIGNYTPAKEQEPSHQIRISNCDFTFNGRQGTSVIGGVDIEFVGCTFASTGQGKIFSAPGAGLDIEAEERLIRKVRIKGCKFMHNKGVGLLADSGDSKDIEADGCKFIGIDCWSIWINKPKFVVKNSIITGSVVHSFLANKLEDATVYDNCYFADTLIDNKRSYGGFLLEINEAKNLKILNCTFNAKDKKATWIEGRHSNSVAEQPIFENCIFNLDLKRIVDNDYIVVARLINYKNTRFNIKEKKSNMRGRFLQMAFSNDLGGNSTNYLREN